MKKILLVAGAAGLVPQPAPRLVALCSPAMGSGKSTVAQHLVEHHGFARVAFAGPIKEMATAFLNAAGVPIGVAYRMVNGDLKEKVIDELGVTSRRIQQTLGTEWGRQHIREDLWVHITLQKVARWTASGKSVVIDDLRFRNELDAIEAAGGQCFRVVRPEAKLTTAAHASEGALDGIHMPEIWNTGDVADLLANADHALFR